MNESEEKLIKTLQKVAFMRNILVVFVLVINITSLLFLRKEERVKILALGTFDVVSGVALMMIGLWTRRMTERYRHKVN